MEIVKKQPTVITRLMQIVFNLHIDVSIRKSTIDATPHPCFELHMKIIFAKKVPCYLQFKDRFTDKIRNKTQN